jgi:predicted PolB exonuclease-like 3'-5' exonuclease
MNLKENEDTREGLKEGNGKGIDITVLILKSKNYKINAIK